MSKRAKKKWERRPAAFKQMAVERMKDHIRNLAKELGVPVSALYRWKQWAEQGVGLSPEVAEDPRERRVRELETKVRQLEGIIGKKTLEQDFFRGWLAKDQGVTPTRKATVAGRPVHGNPRVERIARRIKHSANVSGLGVVVNSIGSPTLRSGSAAASVAESHGSRGDVPRVW